jgi:PAS domain S-box-containing protein
MTGLRHPRELLDAVPDALLVCDARGTILQANAAAAQLLGRPVDSLEGRGLGGLLAGGPREGEEGGAWLARAGVSVEGAAPLRVTAVRPDGERLRVELSVGGARGADGRVEEGGGWGAWRVLSLRQAPAARREEGVEEGPLQGSFLRRAFEEAPVGVFHFDAQGRVRACNPELARLAGLPEARLLGVDLLSLGGGRLEAAVAQVLAGRAARLEGDYHPQCGGAKAQGAEGVEGVEALAAGAVPVRLLLAPVHGAQGEVVGGVGIAEDLTEARAVERARDEQRALVDLLFRGAPVGLGYLDARLRYVRVNDELARLGHLPPEAHAGHTPLELGQPGAPQLEALLRRTLRSGKPLVDAEVTSEELGVDGPATAWRFSVYPVRGAGGHLLGAGLLVEDVTERREAEVERRRLLREAQAAVQVRDDFLTVASHELKTPLTPLSLRLAGLQRRVEKGEPLEVETLRQARQSLGKLATLINDLLDSARVSDGRLSLHRAPTRLDALVERAARATVRPADAQHPLVLRLPDRPLTVFGDPDRLSQVVQNLVDNAVKYSPSGGAVEVELREVGEAAVLAVRDRGIGIPEDQREHLFDRFFRARNASVRTYGGLGLGLYICRDIVERHGGRIWVESRPDGGSTFLVALPLARAAEHPREPGAAGREGRPPRGPPGTPPSAAPGGRPPAAAPAAGAPAPVTADTLH